MNKSKNSSATVTWALQYLPHLYKASNDIQKHIEMLNISGKHYGWAWHIFVEYVGRLTKVAKELWIKKDYNSYWRRCNCVLSFSVQSNADEADTMMQEAIWAFRLSDDFRVTYQLI